MTLMQMKYAIAVADTKSMNEAARSLFITQPSLSASIKELENEIGIELFKRTNRGITVTPEGEEFLGYARQVVEQYRLIESKYIEKEKVRKKRDRAVARRSAYRLNFATSHVHQPIQTQGEPTMVVKQIYSLIEYDEAVKTMEAGADNIGLVPMQHGGVPAHRVPIERVHRIFDECKPRGVIC